MALAFGMIFCVLVDAYDGLNRVLIIMNRVIYYTSGILFPISAIPSKYHYILLYNPLVHLIELGRIGLLRNYIPIRGINFEYPIMFIIISMFIGLWLYYYRRRYLVSI